MVSSLGFWVELNNWIPAVMLGEILGTYCGLRKKQLHVMFIQKNILWGVVNPRCRLFRPRTVSLFSRAVDVPLLEAMTRGRRAVSLRRAVTPRRERMRGEKNSYFLLSEGSPCGGRLNMERKQRGNRNVKRGRFRLTFCETRRSKLQEE